LTEQLYPGSRHSLPVRRPQLPFDTAIPRHWAGGNAVASRAFNGLQVCFPQGERFFLRSVKDLLSRISDVGLMAFPKPVVERARDAELTTRGTA